ncbi:MAG: YvcK family protein [Bryobacterales bacterium]|nr:YvcK family protein [Bryobacterales bacterium]
MAIFPSEPAPRPMPLRVVSIGGGTGLSALLSGLKKYTREYRASLPAHSPAEGTAGDEEIEVSAVVTVTDDGGSSGRLRRELHVPPPGDIRNCLVALSEDSDLLSRLFQYRFDAGEGLKGHSFGNLFLTALSQVMGDFTQAVKVCSEVLAIAGRIYPSTAANVHLEAVLADGTVVVGETAISASKTPIRLLRLKPSPCEPLPETLDAIARAHLITLGPGSLYTSVLPNLLVEGIAEAIAASPAHKVYVSNLMWQPGETMRYSASDHVRAILEHAGTSVLNSTLINTGRIGEDLLRSYREKEAEPVFQDVEILREMGIRVLEADLIGGSDKIRHEPRLLAAALVALAKETAMDKQSPQWQPA